MARFSSGVVYGVLFSALVPQACGAPAMPAPAVATRAPASTVPPAVSESEWRQACSLDPSSRYGAFRRLTERDARARHDLVQANAMAQGGLATAAPLARAIVSRCGCAEAVELTRQMVAIQTIAALPDAERNEPFDEMAAWLSTWAGTAGLSMQEFGERDAWEVTLPGRTGTRTLRLVTHADVAPVNDPPSLIAPDAIPEGWTRPAFAASVADGRLYGRGTEDDKAAIAAALIALREVRASGLVPEGEVVLAIGTAEEHAWEGMRRYAAASKKAVATVSIDSSYPVVTAESGFVAWGLRLPEGKAPRTKQPVVRELHAGLFLTQVPDRGYAVLQPRGESMDALAARAAAAVKAEEESRKSSNPNTHFRFRVRTDSSSLRIEADGVAAHASVPEEGENVIWPLASVLRRLDIATGGVRAMAEVVGEAFDGDDRGERLGVAYSDAFMGPLIVAPTKLRLERGEVVLEVNMRRPAGRSDAEFRADLSGAVARLGKLHAGLAAIDDIYVGSAHSVDASSKTVNELLRIYSDMTGKEGKPISIPGGTYARLFEGGVDFGPVMPGKPYMGHAADEYIEVDTVCETTRMVLEVALRLGVGEWTGKANW